MSLPNPPELFRRFEEGEIDRAELQAMMALHARGLIVEMEEDHRNPAAAWWEGVLARRSMHRMVRRHGATLVRQVLVALADAEFPAARHLWNADHPELPLHCFLRMKKPPVFRLLTLRETGDRCVVGIETSDPHCDRAVKQNHVLVRDARWVLRLARAAEPA